MNKQAGLHDGIYEVLKRIGDYVKEGHTLPRFVSTETLVEWWVLAQHGYYCSHYSNLPSENRAAGIGGNSSRARDAAGAGGRGVGGGGGNPGGRPGDGKNSQSYLYPYGSQVHSS